MENSNDDTVSKKSSVLQLIGDLVNPIAGVPLPPIIKKSLLKSLSGLIAAVFDYPSAWFESKAQNIRDEASGRSLVASAAAKAAAARFEASDELADRALGYFGARLLREQANREAAAVAALECLKLDPPLEDATEEIDQDWLDIFSRIAETRSNKDVQLYLARLLAGEIRRPGSVSPSTIEVLAKLSTETAKAFQEFANMCVTLFGTDTPLLITDPLGNPARNAFKQVGFPYARFTELQDAGLIQTELDQVIDPARSIFLSPIELGGRTLKFSGPLTRADEQEAIGIVSLTRSGMELYRIIHCQQNAIYFEKFIEWIKKRFELTLDE